MNEILKAAIQQLAASFDELLALYDRKITSMEPFETLNLIQVKMTRLETFAKSDSTPVAIIDIINSFTPSLYKKIEQELHQLIPAQRYEHAEQRFIDLKKQIADIHHSLNIPNSTQTAQAKTPEQEKIDEMMRAFKGR